jgi:hypothetical protein
VKEMAVTTSECNLENFEGRTEQNHRRLTQGINPLNVELSSIYHLLALLGAHHILHVSRIRVKVSIGDTARSLSSSQRRSVAIAARKNRGKGKPICFPQPNPTKRRALIRDFDVLFLSIIIFFFVA